MVEATVEMILQCLASVSFSWMENIFQLTMEVHAKSFLQETPLYIWPLKSWQLGICHWWYQALHHLCSRSRQFIPSWFLLQAAWSQANTCKLVIPMWHLLLLEESWFTPLIWGMSLVSKDSRFCLVSWFTCQLLVCVRILVGRALQLLPFFIVGVGFWNILFRWVPYFHGGSNMK